MRKPGGMTRSGDGGDRKINLAMRLAGAPKQGEGNQRQRQVEKREEGVRVRREAGNRKPRGARGGLGVFIIEKNREGEKTVTVGAETSSSETNGKKTERLGSLGREKKKRGKHGPPTRTRTIC